MPVLFCIDDGSSTTEFIPCDLATFREAINRVSSDSSPSNSPPPFCSHAKKKKIDETREEIRRRVAREMSGGPSSPREMSWEASPPTATADSATSSFAKKKRKGAAKEKMETKAEIRARVRKEFAAKKARGSY